MVPLSRMSKGRRLNTSPNNRGLRRVYVGVDFSRSLVITGSLSNLYSTEIRSKRLRAMLAASLEDAKITSDAQYLAAVQSTPAILTDKVSLRPDSSRLQRMTKSSGDSHCRF